MTNETQQSVKFSIIMPCYNTVEYTIQAIQSIMKNTDDYELIVINDGCTDETSGYLQGVSDVARKKGIDFKVLYNDESVGFTVACNQGAVHAEGDFLVFVNNDIVTTPFWAARMGACLEQVADRLPIGKFGITGPVSNYAGGNQLVQDFPQQFKIQDLDAFSDQWYQSNFQAWAYHGFISGFCMMITRDCWFTVGGFDERFTPGGFEDNDICVRAYESGYKSVICGDVFVYHYGTRSTSLPERAYMQGGMHNRGKFYEKYWSELGDSDVPVIAGYRVKNGARWLKDTLDKTIECVDHIVIMDDGSTDKTPDIIKSFMNKHKTKVTHVRHDRPFQELRDRNEVWSMMKEASKQINPDVTGWGMILDADEQLEDKVDRNYIQYLVRPVTPEIHGYVMKIQTFWRGREKIRTDGTFGNLRGVRLVKFTEDQKLWTNHPQGLHCGNTPSVPPDYLAICNVNIKHYGFEDYQIAQEKYDFYSKLDTQKTVETVGGDGSYKHLIDESGLSLLDWVENNTLGLCMIGTNEESFLARFFGRYYFYTLFDQIVFVDCASTDNSKLIAGAFNAEVFDLPDNLIYQEGPYKGRLKHFGKARNWAKGKMNTRYILMMDADEHFDHASFPSLLRIIENTKLDAVRFHVQNHQRSGVPTHSENYRLYRNDPDIFYTQHVHESLEISLSRLKGITTAVAPFPLHHAGYLRDPDYVQVKLDHYEELNNQDLIQDPSDARPYFNLALHYLNEGENEKAVEFLSKACQLNSSFMQAHQELGRVFLRKSFPIWNQALSVCPKDHPHYTQMVEIVKFMHKYAQEPLIVGKPKDKKNVTDAEHVGQGESASVGPNVETPNDEAAL